MTRLALALCLGFFAARLDAASEGTAGADFLKIPVSTRASGMGGALSALSDDLSAMELNPSRLARLDGAVASGGHLAYFEGISMEHVELGYGLNRSGLGLSYESLNSPDIAGLDSQGNPAASFALHDSSAALGYGLGLGRFEAGLSGRYVSRSLAGLNATGFGFDLGLTADLGLGFSLALVAQNLGSLSALESVADPLPQGFREGLGWKGQAFEQGLMLVEADLLQPSDSSMVLRFGAELAWQSAYFIRAGWQQSEAFDSTQGFSAGAGLRYASVQLDYAYVPMSVLGTAHRVSLSVFLNSLFNTGPSVEKRAKLGKPHNLRLTPVSGGMDISWDAPDKGKASSYAVYFRAGASSDFKRANLKALTRRLLHLKGAFGDREYAFTVAAVDAEGNEGERSREITYVPSKAVQKPGAPEAPRKLKALRRGKMIYLRWQKPESEGKLSYQVYLSSESGGAYAPIADGEVSETEQQWEPDGLKSKKAYLVVKTLRHGDDGVEASDFSEEVSVSVR